MRWLKTQNIETKWDFKAEWRWKMSDDELIVIIKEGEEEHKYKRINTRGYKYKRDDNIVDNENFTGCIRRKNIDDSLTILSIEKQTVEQDTTNQIEVNEFPEQILDKIQSRTVVAATDTAMVGNYLANHWIVSTKKNEIITFGGLESS